MRSSASSLRSIATSTLAVYPCAGRERRCSAHAANARNVTASSDGSLPQPQPPPPDTTWTTTFDFVDRDAPSTPMSSALSILGTGLPLSVTVALSPANTDCGQIAPVSPAGKSVSRKSIGTAGVLLALVSTTNEALAKLSSSMDGGAARVKSPQPGNRNAVTRVPAPA